MLNNLHRTAHECPSPFMFKSSNQSPEKTQHTFKKKRFDIRYASSSFALERRFPPFFCQTQKRKAPNSDGRSPKERSTFARASFAGASRLLRSVSVLLPSSLRCSEASWEVPPLVFLGDRRGRPGRDWTGRVLRSVRRGGAQRRSSA